MADEQVLEYRLNESEAESDSTPDPFLAAVASKEPTPGGGSVAALAGALAASLTQMVAGLTLNRRKYADVQDVATAVLDEARTVGEQLAAAIEQDAAAFNALMAVFRDKTLASDEKAAQIQQATIHAAEVPLGVARLSHRAAQLAAELAQVGNSNAVTDAAAGVLMAQAAVETAALNVKINAASVSDQQVVHTWLEELETLSQETADLVKNIKAVAAKRGGFA